MEAGEEGMILVVVKINILYSRVPLATQPQTKKTLLVFFLVAVGEEGFEPSSRKGHDFKSCVYTIPPLARVINSKF